MKKLVLIAALLAACHTETIPSAELQKRLAEEDEFHTGIPLGNSIRTQNTERPSRLLAF